MAKIIIENAEVVRLFADDRGAALKETKVIPAGKRKGESIDLYYTAWAPYGEIHEFDQGDVVSVEGEPSARLNSWNDKETGEEKVNADLVVNDTVLLSGGGYDDEDDEDEGF